MKKNISEQGVSSDNIFFLPKEILEDILPKAGPRFHFLSLISKKRKPSAASNSSLQAPVVGLRTKFPGDIVSIEILSKHLEITHDGLGIDIALEVYNTN